jgi:hypothetical protein
LDNPFGAAIHKSQIADIGLDVTLRAVVCDKGYHAKANRNMTRWRGVVPVIHYRCNVQDQAAYFPKLPERACTRVEQPLTAKDSTDRDSLPRMLT